MKKSVFPLALVSIFVVSSLNGQVNTLPRTSQNTAPVNSQTGQVNSAQTGANLTIPAPGQVIERRLAALEKLVSGLGQQLNALKNNDLPRLSQQTATNKNDIAQLGQSVQSNITSVGDLLKLAQVNEAAIRALTVQVNDNNAKLLQTVKQSGQGAYYLNYNMQIPDARREFTKAVGQSGTNQIRLWIYNPGPERIITINGARWRAILGWSYVWVPFGTVAVSDITNATPPIRAVGEQHWNPVDREYQMYYDLRKPWR